MRTEHKKGRGKCLVPVFWVLSVSFFLVLAGCGSSGDDATTAGAGDSLANQSDSGSSQSSGSGPGAPGSAAAPIDIGDAPAGPLVIAETGEDSQGTGAATPALMGDGTGVAQVDVGVVNNAFGPSVGSPGETETVGFAVDTVARRVHLTGFGWVSEREFWRIYYRQSELLPADIDHGLLAQFGYKSAAEVGLE